jgi:hypothetical protein
MRKIIARAVAASVIALSSTVLLPGSAMAEAGDLPSSGTASTVASEAAALAGIRTAFPAKEWVRAEMVARCESGLRSVSSKPNANGTRDHGLFQLNDGGTLQGLLGRAGADPSDIALALDPEWNARAAAELWKSRGWQPWTCAAKLGIVAGLWSYEPGPNGGDSAFDPAKAESVVMASSLASRSAQASAELEATTRAELSSLEGQAKDIAVTLTAQKNLLDTATSAARDGRTRVADAEAAATRSSEEAATARGNVVELGLELEQARADLASARDALGSQARANYISGGASGAAASLSTLTLMTSSGAADALQARNVAGTVLERRASLTEQVRTNAEEVARLGAAARTASQKADIAESEANAARELVRTEQAALEANEAQARVSADQVQALLTQVEAATGETRARLDVVVNGLIPPAPILSMG